MQTACLACGFKGGMSESSRAAPSEGQKSCDLPACSKLMLGLQRLTTWQPSTVCAAGSPWLGNAHAESPSRLRLREVRHAKQASLLTAATRH